MVRRDNQWQIQIPDKSINSIKKYCEAIKELVRNHPELKEKLPKMTEEDISKIFIKNCYRVLLTRARIATHIYVQDKETYEYLSGLF